MTDTIGASGVFVSTCDLTQFRKPRVLDEWDKIREWIVGEEFSPEEIIEHFGLVCSVEDFVEIMKTKYDYGLCEGCNTWCSIYGGVQGDGYCANCVDTSWL